MKWELFETEFIEHLDVQSISINNDEIGLITIQNNVVILNRYYNNNGYICIDNNNTFEFPNILECLQYLRCIRMDNAINYEYRNLVKKLISQLYSNNLISQEDVIK